MRPRRSSIHMSISHFSIRLSKLHQIINLIISRNVLLSKVCNIHSSTSVLMYIQVILFRIQQISYFLKVNLCIRNFYWIFHMLSGLLYILKDSRDHSWNNPHHLLIVQIRARHGKSFTWRCLTVSKDCSVEPFHDCVDHWFGCVTVDVSLSWRWGKYVVEVKSDWDSSGLRWSDWNCGVVWEFCTNS